MVVNIESIKTDDAKELILGLGRALEEITGSTGNHSFSFSDMENERAMFAIAREDDGEPIGCGAIREIDHHTAELKRVFSLKRRNGAGKMIVRFLEQQAKDLSYERIILETRKCNENAVNFYLGLGYKVIENYGIYVGVEDAVCFEKILNK